MDFRLNCDSKPEKLVLTEKLSGRFPRFLVPVPEIAFDLGLHLVQFFWCDKNVIGLGSNQCKTVQNESKPVLHNCLTVQI